MKKAILILLFISTQIYSYSQDYDLIVTTNGNSIACYIDSISHNKIYFEMMVDSIWVQRYLEMKDIKEHKRKAIEKDSYIFFEGSSIIQGKIKPKIYKTWVSLNEEPFKIKGVLYELKDSSILVSNSVIIKDYSTNRFETINLHMNSIETIKTRRNNGIGRGVWIGAVSGFVIGGLVGLVGFPDDPLAAPFYCNIGAAAGTGIGALVGSFKVKIPINGNINNYNKQKNKLRKYSLQ